MHYSDSFIVLINTLGQERYYFNISDKTKANHTIDIYEIENHTDSSLTFNIQSLTLLKSKKGWDVDRIRKLEMADDLIFVTDISNTNFYIYDFQGNPKKKIDITNYEKKAWITDYAVFKDTIYMVDNRSLFLFKFTTQGDFLSRELLTFNFEDFIVNKEGVYFISNHDAGKKNTVRINVFDHSLNLLKQYFVYGEKKDLLIKPRFFLGEDGEILFSVMLNNEVFNIDNESLVKFLKIEHAGGIRSYAHAHGLHSFSVSHEDHRPGEPIDTYYVKKDSKANVWFETFRSVDLSEFLFHGVECGIHQDSFVSYYDFNSKDFFLAIPDINWSKDHSNIKKKFFEIIDQINEYQQNVVVLYKIIDNSTLID